LAKYSVEMFGLPYEISGTRRVDFELEDGAGISDIIGALKREIPELDGEVIVPGLNQLMEGFTFNINGRFYSNDGELKLHEGDRIVLLTLATIG